MSLRTLWSLLTVFLVAVVAIAMMISIADIEKQAWRSSEQEQATLLISLLADELKMPMVAVSRPEVDHLIRLFTHHLSGAAVFLRWSNGQTEQFGDVVFPDAVEALAKLPPSPAAVTELKRWYGMGIVYNNTRLGSLAVMFPGKSWRDNDLRIKKHLIIVATLVALLSMLLTYGLSGRIVKQLRLLARASKRVAGGDFAVQLPIRSANEFGKAFYQFNKMVSRLEQREKVFDLYGRYQRPHLVADEFDRNTRLDGSLKREVSIVAVEMVGFDTCLEQMQSDQLIGMLNRYLALLQQLIHAFGGHVDRVDQARVVAVFNHPFDLKCHENQAAKAALAIIAAAKKMAIRRPDGSDVILRAGMAIGEVSVGHLGVGRRKELTVIGEPVALADQLAGTGDGGCVVAPYGTMLSLGHGFRQKDLGEQTLPNGRVMRCIHILPGEAYVTQEVEAALSKALARSEADESTATDEGW